MTWHGGYRSTPKQSGKRITERERARREAQSAKDKAMLLPRKDPKESRARPVVHVSMTEPSTARGQRRNAHASRPSGGSGQGTSRPREKWRSALLELKRGLPFTTPTRLELINTRVRFKIPLDSSTVQSPVVLFHPARSVSHLLVVGGGHLGTWYNASRGEPGQTAAWEWVGDLARSPDGVNHAVITDPGFGSAQAIGVPSTLISPLTRVTGGVLTLKITCGPGTTGYLAFSSPAISEITSQSNGPVNNGLNALVAAHATNPRVRRYELMQGTQTHHFTAPIVSPPALEVFDEANPQFVWGPDEAFGGTVITFHDVNYNNNLGVPAVVELYATVGIQCRLEIADRHLATTHDTGTKEAKMREHASAEGSAHLGTSQSGMAEHNKATLTVGPTK